MEATDYRKKFFELVRRKDASIYDVQNIIENWLQLPAMPAIPAIPSIAQLRLHTKQTSENSFDESKASAYMASHDVKKYKSLKDQKECKAMECLSAVEASGASIIYFASRSGNVSLLKWSLEKSLGERVVENKDKSLGKHYLVNKRRVDNGYTPLLAAILAGRKQCVVELVSSKHTVINKTSVFDISLDERGLHERRLLHNPFLYAIKDNQFACADVIAGAERINAETLNHVIRPSACADVIAGAERINAETLNHVIRPSTGANVSAMSMLLKWGAANLKTTGDGNQTVNDYKALVLSLIKNPDFQLTPSNQAELSSMKPNFPEITEALQSRYISRIPIACLRAFVELIISCIEVIRAAFTPPADAQSHADHVVMGPVDPRAEAASGSFNRGNGL